MTNTSRRWWVLLVPILWAGAIFLASSIPGNVLSKLIILSWDKVFHVAEFAVLVIAIAWSISRVRTSKWSPVILIIAFVIAAVYAPVDEWHQSWVPGRDVSILDMAADWTGCAIGSIASFWIR
jgi:VanZ family protein